MKKIIYFFTLLGLYLSASAQSPSGPGLGGKQGQETPNIGHVFGKVVDSAGKGIGDVSVLLLQTLIDPTTRKSKDVFLKGVSSQANGDFDFEDLPVKGIL